MKRKERIIKGYHHIFYHTGGGCGVGPCAGINNGYACDDDFKCLNCGFEVRILSKPEGHFNMPTFFEGREHCNPKHDKKIEIVEHNPDNQKPG